MAHGETPRIPISINEYNSATGEVIVEPEEIPGKLCIVMSRVPYDDAVTIKLPNGSEEYVLSDKADRLLRLHGVKNPDKYLTHLWNFYSAIIYVDDPLYEKSNTADKEIERRPKEDLGRAGQS